MSKEDANRKTPLTLETLSEIAVENTLKDGFHIPTLIIEGSQQNLTFTFEELGRTPEIRQLQFFLSGIQAFQQGKLGLVKQLFFISEAWMSRQVPGEAFVRPAVAPNRIEALIISTMHAQTRQMNVMSFEMVRDQAKVLREIRPLADMKEPDTQANSPLLTAFLNGIATGSRKT